MATYKTVSFGAKELAWIKAHCKTPRRALHAEFCIKFQRRDVTLRNIERLCESNRWLTGRSRKTRPIGSERLCRDGYLMRKFNHDHPQNRRWRPVHLVRWEQENGPVPSGHRLKCLDGNKQNTDPSNWKAIPRAMIPRLAGFKIGFSYDQAPDELKPAIMATAELEQAAREARKRRTSSPRHPASLSEKETLDV